jgi:hypothetical protein
MAWRFLPQAHFGYRPPLVGSSAAEHFFLARERTPAQRRNTGGFFDAVSQKGRGIPQRGSAEIG